MPHGAAPVAARDRTWWLRGSMRATSLFPYAVTQTAPAAASTPHGRSPTATSTPSAVAVGAGVGDDGADEGAALCVLVDEQAAASSSGRRRRITRAGQHAPGHSAVTIVLRCWPGCCHRG